MVGFNQGERVEAAWVGVGRRHAAHPAPPARRVADPVQRDGVADEAILEEDARVGDVVGGIEAQLDLAALELRADLQVAAAKADRPVLADDAALAVQKDVVEVLRARQRAEEGEFREPVLTRTPSGRVMAARVIFRSQPRPMLRIERGERERMVR